jgi:hypothetical protein
MAAGCKIDHILTKGDAIPTVEDTIYEDGDSNWKG